MKEKQSTLHFCIQIITYTLSKTYTYIWREMCLFLGPHYLM